MHIITMLLLLSVLILVHEFGHFIVARKLGIKVDRFGFGLPFGPTLYETKWKDVTVCVHSFLLGGYVSFPDDDPDSDIPKDSPLRIANRKVWERFLVISAGVTANAIIAYVIVLMVAGFSGSVPANKYNIFADSLEQKEGYSAAQTGMESGDKIISANGKEIDSLSKFVGAAKRSKKFNNYITYDRHEAMITKIVELNPALFLPLENQKESKIPEGVSVKLPAETPESPVDVPKDIFSNYREYKPEGKYLNKAEQELRTEVYGRDEYFSDGSMTLAELAAACGDTVHPINIIVERNSNPVILKPAYPNEEGIIGVKLKVEEINMPVKSAQDAIVKSWDYLQRNAVYMVKGLGMIFTGQIPMGDLHGIVAVTKIGSDIISNRGIWDGLLLTALISIDLAIVNLLPIPALDGGHLMFLFIEKLRGRPVEEKTQENFAKFGFMFLIGLMVLIIFNDVFALVTDKL